MIKHEEEEMEMKNRKTVCVLAGCCWLGADPSGMSHKVASADPDAKKSAVVTACSNAMQCP
jgi:hypothetical protein